MLCVGGGGGGLERISKSDNYFAAVLETYESHLPLSEISFVPLTKKPKF